ncbi:adenine deaminase C-terminal domain-containing protein [Caldivirga sp. UBA161]|uniref:adenine deaminase C-terminal domain-containing protein n=1 Tax=Caldivirga sp. UBA161 TaxID=1915569 RepID=UPI0025C73780|nr:adenine deaminase C-terminal domain-containing protein [Caldivirga sp. UBA161]
MVNDEALTFPGNVMIEYIGLMRELIEASRGLRKANLIIRDVNVVDVAGGRIVEGLSIIVYSKFIAALTKSSKDGGYVGLGTRIINGRGMYVTPGFIDAHVHIESSFLAPVEFAKLALRHGTTLIVADPHDITNVGGVNYLINFAKSAINLPLKILMQIPPCVPPTNLDVDNPGAVLKVEDINQLINTGLFHSLGEFMDYSSVIKGDEDSLAKIKLALGHGMMVYGHLPSDDEDALNAYSVASPSSCHESINVGGALEKLLRGMWVMPRFGTAWRDAEAIIPELAKNSHGISRLMLVTDDVSVTDLVERGYMDYVVKRIIEHGIDPINAFRMVTVNPATYLRLDNLIGLVAPGRVSDLVLLNNYEEASINTVVVNGEVIYHDGQILLKDYDTNKLSNLTLMESPFNIPKIHNLSDLAIGVNMSSGTALVLAAGIRYGITVTKKVKVEVPVVNGLINPNPFNDVSYIAVIDRYRGRYIGKGFIHGLGLRTGAIAQTIGRDTHNILVLGMNLSDMLIALRELEKLRGGIITVRDGEIKCRVPLKLGGLMSSEPYDKVYREVKCVEDFLQAGGVTEPRMALFHISLMPVIVIPEIRITPKGVVDVNEGRVVNPVLNLY